MMRQLVIAWLVLLVGTVGTAAAAEDEILARGKPLGFWVKQLKDRNAEFRATAAKALGEFGPDGKAAVPALTEALKDKDAGVRAAAIEALGEIAPNETKDLRKCVILVAKKHLPQGTLIADPEQLFERKAFDPDDVPRDALTRFEEIKNRRLRRSLIAENHITPRDLMGETCLEPGTRAYSVRVDSQDKANGFILPGCLVDVIWTYRDEKNEVASRTVLYRVSVLAVDTGSPAPGDKKAPVPMTVTLQLDPEMCELLKVCQDTGDIRLILRPWGDYSEKKTRERSKPPASEPPPR